MKTKIFIICLLLLSGCKKQSPQYNFTIFGMFDFTDKKPVIPTAKQLITLIGLHTNPFSGLKIGFTFISDKDINKWEFLNIEAEDPIFSNKIRRNLQVESFEKRLDTLLNIFQDTSLKPCAHSIIYRPLVEVLNNLSKATTSRKVLIISSNLYENSSLSFYTANCLNLLKCKPNKVLKIFEEESQLQDLTGIEIFILYKPIGFTDNNNFMIVSNFYKKLFESKGAIVKISTNL